MQPDETKYLSKVFGPIKCIGPKDTKTTLNNQYVSLQA